MVNQAGRRMMVNVMNEEELLKRIEWHKQQIEKLNRELRAIRNGEPVKEVKP